MERLDGFRLAPAVALAVEDGTFVRHALRSEYRDDAVGLRPWHDLVIASLEKGLKKPPRRALT